VNAVRQFDALERVDLPAGRVHLAIGMFDGVHRGHQAVIRSTIESARARGGWAGVLTFTPHPSEVLRPDQAVKLIHPLELKRRLLAALGIDFLIEHPFTPAFAGMSAPAFLAELKTRLPGIERVYVGENFRFGRGREGDLALLNSAALAAGFAVHSMPRIADEQGAISSSRLRELLKAGQIESANALLGYSYFSEGRVQAGQQLGRTLGFPTLNIAWAPALRPAFGVYAVVIRGADGIPLLGVANYGLRPTVEEAAAAPRLEVHVLGSTTLTYGEPVRVQWLRFLRAEKKFGGLDELRAQVELDCGAAAAALREISPQNFPNSA
jgi:riboflavin kinase/FMN adenylyltransferase